MPRPPNYSHERKERDRIKAAKKAEKQAAREAERQRARTAEVGEDAPDEPKEVAE